MQIKRIGSILSDNIYKKISENKIKKLDDYIETMSKKQVATATLTQRYNHQHLSAWKPAKINLNKFKTTTSELKFENNQIKIGKGITKILVSGQIAFWRGANSIVSFLQSDILLNGISNTFCTIINNDVYQLSCVLTPILLEVKENDLIGLGTSFGPELKTFGVLENGTYLTVEVIE